jgi:hypothetical protein
MKLSEYLAGSAATPGFREAVEAFTAGAGPAEKLSFPVTAPRVKVERTLTKLLEEYPTLPIEGADIKGHSGCEFFRGIATIRADNRVLRVHFEWNCKWKAMELGWKDYFGFPDQVRAAHEFGHDCFRAWEEEGVEELAGA